MRCYYYCNGYCFWNGDTGEVCDKIMFGTHRRRKDGYCPREESDRELEKIADLIVAFEEEKKRKMYEVIKAESGIESIYAPMQTLGIEDCKMYVLRMVVEEVINCDCNAYDELKGLYCTALDCRKKDKAFNAEILKAFEYYIANEQEFLRLIDEEVKAVRERRNKQRID